ncbi:hypothetical protein M758_6G031000, partial [Ceratodon purpureus]
IPRKSDGGRTFIIERLALPVPSWRLPWGLNKVAQTTNSKLIARIVVTVFSSEVHSVLRIKAQVSEANLMIIQCFLALSSLELTLTLNSE